MILDKWPTLEEQRMITGLRPNGTRPVPGRKKRYSEITHPELYHSYKNTQLHVICWLFLTPVLFIFGRDGIALFIFIWIYYFAWCHDNNEKLRKNPHVQRQIYLIDEVYKWG